MKKKIGMLSLGCDKNRVDSENILFSLKQGGYDLAENYTDADYILVNTCAFIDIAKEESIEAILESAEAISGKGKKLIVVGCLAERYAEEISADLPEVDVFVGINSYHKIKDILDNIDNTPKIIKDDKKIDYNKGRLLTTPLHYAYLKIADGCNNFCSYCAIPKIRGRYKSTPIEELVAEARQLYDYGVKELILVAQDTTRYGYDLYKKHALLELLSELEKIDFKSIRLLYTYPELVSEEIIDYIIKSKKIVNYLDIPLQHISDNILLKMNRRISKKGIEKLLEMIKNKDSNFVIRSTFIVGFPGEGEKEFNELKQFITHSPIDYAGFFVYSEEEGTAACDFPQKNSEQLKKQRAVELESLQLEKIEKNNKKYIGKTLRVIYEGIDYDNECFYGRADFNAPDIDSQVLFTASYPLDIGEYYNVKINKADINLYGEVT